MSNNSADPRIGAVLSFIDFDLVNVGDIDGAEGGHNWDDLRCFRHCIGQENEGPNEGEIKGGRGQ